MAKFIPGPLVSEIRNALGAQVFSRNQWGAFTRARVNPDNTETPDRATAKLIMLDAADAWQTAITDSQRIAWNAFADSMKVRAKSPIKSEINGVALFIKLWILSLWWSGNSLTDPPPDLDTPELELADLSSDGVASELWLDFAPDPVPAGQLLMVYATPPMNPGVLRPHQFWKPITMLPAGTTSPQNIWTDYEAAHGTPTPGKKIFSRVRAAYEYNNLPSVPTQSVTLVEGDPDAMLTAVVTISNAQMLAMAANGLQLVAAPGANKALLFIGAELRVIYGTVAFDWSNSPQWAVFAGAYAQGTVISTAVGNNFLFQGTDNRNATLPPSTNSDVDAYFVNATLTMGAAAGGELLTGDGTGQLIIAYAIVDV